MKNKILFPIILILILLPLALAQDHYTYEHAEEMKNSGRIEWRDYGPDAYKEAIKENKPIFLMLTAPSWCYWCHVYTSDDYIYHEDVYPTINNDFIPIYVDADKRQDLTRKYLEGGWPSTTVMTPSGDRIFGYSGPRPIENMLENLNQAKEFVKDNRGSNKISYEYKITPQVTPNEDQLNGIINFYSNYLIEVHDKEYGGFGTGQKFPQGRSLDFSLDIYEKIGDERFLEIVKNTLSNQYTKTSEIKTNYNLYDPIEGGFHRYGTTREWSPPHYEKMLYDNARLLKAYSHLLKISPNDEIAKEVVDKTELYIRNNWYDSAYGGFYGNTDVHGEDVYYGKNPRSSDKPRIEKTKYTDWNSEAILTYLYLWRSTSNKDYKNIAERSLIYYAQNIDPELGINHYSKVGEEMKGQGNIVDNSYLLLAFIEGKDVLGDSRFLDFAIQLADYSLDNLYDWNNGGFFERNSLDIDNYAPGENIQLTKPPIENGVMSYAMLRLYRQTGDIRYLNAGYKTLGRFSNEIGSLDSGYYFIKASQFTMENGLISEYFDSVEDIKLIEQKELENFWVDDLEIDNNSNNNKFVQSDIGLYKLQGSIFILIFIALFSGFISFASPCTLPILPAYIAYTFESSQKNIKGMTLSFFLGLSFVFVILGMTATVIGNLFKSNLTIFTQVTGILIMFFGFFILIGKGFKGITVKQKRPVSYTGSFIFGGILGLSWTPCVGPILVAILLLASTTSSVFTGGTLLFFYAIGLAIPLLILSNYISKINKEGKIWKFIRGKIFRIRIAEKLFLVRSTSIISGVLFIILGYLIFSGILFTFNQYVASSSFQQFIFGIEDWVLSWFR